MLIDIDDLPTETQEDIVHELLSIVPWLAAHADATDVRSNLIGLVEPVPVLLTFRDPKKLRAQFKRRRVSKIAVKALVSKLEHLEDLDPVLVDRDKFLDGGHRVSAYVAAGRKRIPVVDIHGLVNLDWERWMAGESVEISP